MNRLSSGQLVRRHPRQLGFEAVVIRVRFHPALAQHLFQQNHGPDFGNQAVEQPDLRLLRVELHLPQLLVQAAQQAGQVPVAQGVAQGKSARGLVASANGSDVLELNFRPVADVKGDFLDLAVELARRWGRRG